jgi:hypothetical protein
MDPLPHVPHFLVPGSQTVCYLPWLKVSVTLRYVRTFPWAPEAWPRALFADAGCLMSYAENQGDMFRRAAGARGGHVARHHHAGAVRARQAVSAHREQI